MAANINGMCAFKAVPALGQRFRLPILLLSVLFEVVSLTETQECQQLLPLPNLNADAIVIGELQQYRADEQYIDISEVDVVAGTLLDSKDCWRSLGNIRTLAISTSSLPRDCNGVNTAQWTVGKQYILSLSIGNASVCPSLLHDGLHSPILLAYPTQEGVRLRRQSTVCK